MKCGESHSFNTKHFPLEERQEGTQKLMGYVCKKCMEKQQRAYLIKKFKIVPANPKNNLGKKVGDLISDAYMNELKLANQPKEG
jgi:hypothetical protein